MTVTRLIARPMLASMFVVGGLNALKNADALAARAQPVADKVVPLVQRLAPQAPIPTNTTTLVRLNAGVQVARRCRARDRARARAWPRPCWPPRWCRPRWPATASGRSRTRPSRRTRRIHFFKNVSMFGGLLLAGVDTDGKPGVAWRARRAATDVTARGPAPREGRAA